MDIEGRDIKENEIKRIGNDVLGVLLRDRTTGGNIVWATDNYEGRYGEEYGADCEMRIEQITGERGEVIRPRVDKSKEEQTRRVKDKAEVFTPSWVCNKMVNWMDEEWFGRRNVFNTEIKVDGKCGWAVQKSKIEFPEGKCWQDYVKMRVLEITCGEAPFLVSRYDTTTGEEIELAGRIGVLDRKLRVVKENTQDELEWMEWAKVAYQSIFGYEWQGDSLLLAREALLFTFIAYFQDKFGKDKNPAEGQIKEIADIISWNMWQMDGLRYCVPGGEPAEEEPLMASLFGGEETSNEEKKKSPLCKIKDWTTGKEVVVRSIQKNNPKLINMKFDFIIGNPPYQESKESTSDAPIYNYFYDEAFKNGKVIELISPARFLFDAGKTPKAWNEKMLKDEFVKILDYEQDSSKVFSNTDIKGGIAIVYKDKDKKVGAIEVFSAFEELRSILFKVKPYVKEDKNITAKMFLQNRFNLDKLYENFPELKSVISSEGRERRIVSSSFEKVTAFHDEKEAENDIRVLGLVQNKRLVKWIKQEYVEDNGNLKKYKVLVPKSNGTGAIGEILSTPLIGEPLIGYTQSFIGIGAVDTKEEALSILKYIKTRFARTMLGILKITQDNPPEKWKYVPLQDFTEKSDIDWSKSVAEIDEQLFDKYGLDEKERKFINEKVRAMA